MQYTVKRLAKLAGVSARTLHFYDEIGLLTPAAYGENGYRFYDEEDLLRLQQILFFKELDFSLAEIKDTLGRPDFDVLQTLQAHRQALEARAGRLARLIQTVDRTILHLEGVTKMNENEYFQGFSDEQQKRYEQEARERWGNDQVEQSVQRWGSYDPERRQAIMAEGERITLGFRDNMAKGPASAEVQGLVDQWYNHLRYFYDPNLDILEGLGHAYAQDLRFAAFYRKIDPGLPEFLEQAITYYCDHHRAK